MITTLKRVARALVPAALVAALTCGVGIATGAIPDAGGVIHSCYKTPNGQLRVIDTDHGAGCRRDETALNLPTRPGRRDPPDPLDPRVTPAPRVQPGPPARRATPARGRADRADWPQGRPGP